MARKRGYSESDMIAIGRLRGQGFTRDEAEAQLALAKKIKRIIKKEVY